MSVRHECPVCGLVYERNAGDTWAFWVVADRIPIAVAIAAIYCGFRPQSWAQGAMFFAVLAMSVVGTIPERLGFVIALDYLSRRYWPDPADLIPPR